MDLALYDVITLFIVVPILLFRFTTIPKWIFAAIRRMPTTVLVVILALILVTFAAIVVTVGSQGFAIRFMALGVAVMACAAHYLYNAWREKEDEKTEQEK